MNWQRTALLLRFDLFYALLRLRAWIFLGPFILCWIALFKQINKGVAEVLQSQEGIMFTSALYGTDGALNLFIENPPGVSVFFLVTLSTIPFFTVLAAYDQFSSDLGNGFFRFLSTRCTRLEIFLARFLSAFSLLAAAFLITAVISAGFSMNQDDYPPADIFTYTAWVYVVLLLYTLPYVAYMSLVSSLVRSALGSLFLGFAGFALIWIMNVMTFFSGNENLFDFLLASAYKSSIIELNTGDFYWALAVLPVYTLLYGTAAYLVFKRRNL